MPPLILTARLVGLPFSFGVFEKYYAQHEPFSSQPGIPAIGTTGLVGTRSVSCPGLLRCWRFCDKGLAYFIAPFAAFTLQRWPAQRKNASIFGLVLILISLLAASCATSVAHLILTQGILYGIGGALLYNPFLFYLDEWFIKRKGLAYGIFFSGTGLCGSFIPAILEWGLDNYGFRLTLQIWALVVVRFRPLFALFALPCSFPRFPLSSPLRVLTRRETGRPPLFPCLFPQTTPTPANCLHPLHSYKYRLPL